jgi:hypothetical protein
MEYGIDNNVMNGSLRIVKLIAQETGTYNPLYSRPYETHVSPGQLDSIAERVERNSGGSITPTMFAGMASGILTPSATPQNEIHIPYGWTDRRIRFVMEVEAQTNTGVTLVYYFQGYTSYLGISPSGNVDPTMEFIINSVVTVARTQQMIPNVGVTMVDRIKDSSHILNGAILRKNNTQDVYSIRPQDVFSGIQVGYLNNAHNLMGKQRSKIVDTRAQFCDDSIGSKRNNSISSNFLSTVVSSYQDAQNLAEFGQHDSDITERARTLAFQNDPFISDNAFIRALSSIKGYGSTSSFTIGDLARIDPNIQYTFKYTALAPTVKASMHYTGQTSYWNGTDRETLIATILSNAVPALMMDLMFTKLVFRSTNADVTGRPTTIFADGKSLTNLDPTNQYNIFKTRFETEVMFDITYGNQDTYMLDMSSNLFGETTLSISINGGPTITYTTPSFCDSLNTPVVTTDKDNFFKLTHDFESIFNYINEGNTSIQSINNLV